MPRIPRFALIIGFTLACGGLLRDQQIPILSLTFIGVAGCLSFIGAYLLTRP